MHSVFYEVFCQRINKIPVVFISNRSGDSFPVSLEFCIACIQWLRDVEKLGLNFVSPKVRCRGYRL